MYACPPLTTWPVRLGAGVDGGAVTASLTQAESESNSDSVSTTHESASSAPSTSSAEGPRGCNSKAPEDSELLRAGCMIHTHHPHQTPFDSLTCCCCLTFSVSYPLFRTLTLPCSRPEAPADNRPCADQGRAHHIPQDSRRATGQPHARAGAFLVDCCGRCCC